MDKNNITYMICDGFLKLLNISPKVAGIYVLGNISLIQKPIIGIVGPRKMSQYGKKILDMLFEELQTYDIVTVSGGAVGTDMYVHMKSLECNIPTIVVLGGGIGRYQDTGKIHFLDRVVQSGGLIVSEYDVFLSPQKYTFPQRNRIIAGLSDTIFLPEAGLASGSLITVDKGIEYGKKVYAPMQDIFSETSRGTNQYIAEGKITPLVSLHTFLDLHFTRISSTTIKTFNQKKKGISPSLSLVEQSMLELGI